MPKQSSKPRSNQEERGRDGVPGNSRDRSGQLVSPSAVSPDKSSDAILRARPAPGGCARGGGNVFVIHFEHRGEPLAPTRVFLRRLANQGGVTLLLIAFCW